MSRHLASRLGPNVTVNTLALGPFRSKMMKATLDKYESEMAESMPLKRIGKPEDVVAGCLYLSGKGAAWVTGYVNRKDCRFSLAHAVFLVRATISIDGGESVRSSSKL